MTFSLYNPYEPEDVYKEAACLGYLGLMIPVTDYQQFGNYYNHMLTFFTIIACFHTLLVIIISTFLLRSYKQGKKLSRFRTVLLGLILFAQILIILQEFSYGRVFFKYCNLIREEMNSI